MPKLKCNFQDVSLLLLALHKPSANPDTHDRVPAQTNTRPASRRRQEFRLQFSFKEYQTPGRVRRFCHQRCCQGRCSNTTECCVDLIQPNPYCLNPPSAPSQGGRDVSHSFLALFFQGALNRHSQNHLFCRKSDLLSSVSLKGPWTIPFSSVPQTLVRFVSLLSITRRGDALGEPPVVA